MLTTNLLALLTALLITTSLATPLPDLIIYDNTPDEYFRLQVFPSGPVQSFTGSREQVHNQLLKLNPNYDNDFPDVFLEFRNTPPPASYQWSGVGKRDGEGEGGLEKRKGSKKAGKSKKGSEDGEEGGDGESGGSSVVQNVVQDVGNTVNAIIGSFFRKRDAMRSDGEAVAGAVVGDVVEGAANVVGDILGGIFRKRDAEPKPMNFGFVENEGEDAVEGSNSWKGKHQKRVGDEVGAVEHEMRGDEDGVDGGKEAIFDKRDEDLAKRMDGWRTSVCNARWPAAQSSNIDALIMDVLMMNGKPVLEKGPGKCGLVECKGGDSIWWCNDTGNELTIDTYADIQYGARMLRNACSNNNMVTLANYSGQIFRDNRDWNVIVRGGCN